MAGLVVATIALASLAGNPLGGAMADRWTPRRVLMTGLMVAAAGSVALARPGLPPPCSGRRPCSASGWP